MLLISLSTLPALLLIIFLADSERARALRQSQSEAQYFVDLVAREHLYQISGARGLLTWLTGQMSEEKTGKAVMDSKFLASLLAGYPQLGNIAILSAGGDVVSSAHPVPGNVNMASYGAIKRALVSQDIETGVYVIGPIVRRPLLHLAKSVRDRAGKVRWIAFVAIDLEWLKRLAGKVEVPLERTLLIVDRNGTVLASSGSGGGAGYAVGEQIPALAAGESSGASPAAAAPAGKTRSFVVAPMEDVPGIFIATALSQEHINDAANVTFFRMFGLLLLVTLLTVVSVVVLEEVTLMRWLRALSRASRRFGEGDYSVRVAVREKHGELANMARTFNSMAETLTSRHEELKHAHDRLGKLTRHLQIARESEAQRIARDLHDEVGQVLTSIKMDLARVDSKCNQSCGSSVLGEAASIREKIDGLVDFVRRIASDLRPPVLDRMGLGSAVELLARNAERSSSLVIDVELDGLQEPIDWLISITLYRIVQESLTNIVRHSGATEARIRISAGNGEIILIVEDNGRGIDHTQGERESLGIISMQERARLVGGTFRLDSSPNGGTAVAVTIPQECPDG